MENDNEKKIFSGSLPRKILAVLGKCAIQIYISSWNHEALADKSENEAEYGHINNYN